MAAAGKRRVRGEKAPKQSVYGPRKGYYFLPGLHRIRVDRWVTQQQLAELAGISRPMISLYETLDQRASPRMRAKLADALNVDERELLLSESLAERELKRYEEERETA